MTTAKIVALFVSGVLLVKSYLGHEIETNDHTLKLIKCVQGKRTKSVEEAIILCEREMR